MIIYGDLASGNCLKVKYTADYLGLPYRWAAVDITKAKAARPRLCAAIRWDRCLRSSSMTVAA